MSNRSDDNAVILEIALRQLASNLWQAVLIDDAELAAVAATPGTARAELRTLVSIALGVPSAMILFSAPGRVEDATGGASERPVPATYTAI